MDRPTPTPEVLADAAFGPNPGRWPLPTANDTTGRWLRAVAAGGQGRYAGARADLAEVLRDDPSSPVAARALCTLASFQRQQGWHRRAAGLDGQAFARACGDVESGVDALAGLAADSLGVGRLAAAAALLARAEDLHRRSDAPPPRLAIRLAWVTAELAMAAGDGPEALRHAGRAVELADQALPALRRHRIKSDVVLAAALCCSGDIPAARRTAERALADTAEHRLAPLRWAVSCLLADIGSAVHSPAEILVIRAGSADFVTRHGGSWSSG